MTAGRAQDKGLAYQLDRGPDVPTALRGDPRTRELPVIAMTAHAMAEARERCVAEGMNGHIAKPMDPASFYDQLAGWLAAHPAATPAGTAPLACSADAAGESTSSVGASPRPRAETIDPDALRPVLDELERPLERDDVRAAELFATHAAALRSALGAHADAIERFITAYAIPEALEALRQAKTGLDQWRSLAPEPATAHSVPVGSAYPRADGPA